MSNYYYVKNKKRINKKKFVRLGGVVSIFSGVILALYFFFPLISYQLFLASAFTEANIEVPIPKYMVLNNNGNIGDVISGRFEQISSDYTDARNWYPSIPNNNDRPTIDSYSLSIPKLKIENAKVSTTDYDLSKHLVHYAGTSNPGEKGTAVIFGHSTLPQLFNPKDYKAIFATAHTLKNDDIIQVTVAGKTYSYKIYSIFITTPDDGNMFSQSYDASYLTLVTCTPPGTVWKRLVIRAVQVENNV